jgi:hypothetical protein
VDTAAPAWAGLEIRRCPALRRTHLVVYGAIDDERVAAVREVVVAAFAEGHKVTFDLHKPHAGGADGDRSAAGPRRGVGPTLTGATGDLTKRTVV